MSQKLGLRSSNRRHVGDRELLEILDEREHDALVVIDLASRIAKAIVTAASARDIREWIGAGRLFPAMTVRGGATSEAPADGARRPCA